MQRAEGSAAKRFSRLAAASLVLCAAAFALCSCEMPEWAGKALESQPVQKVLGWVLPEASVDPADVPEVPDGLAEAMGTAEGEDVPDDLLAMERQVVINVHSFEDAAAIITDLPWFETELATFGTFVISDDSLAAIQREIDVLDTNRFDLGFLLIDLETGAGLYYNIDDLFFCASSIKAINLTAILYYHPEAFTAYYSDFRAALLRSNNESYEYIFNAYSDDIPNLWRARVGMAEQQGGRLYTVFTCRDLSRLWCVTWDYLSQETEITANLHEWLGNSLHSCFAKVLGGRDGYQVCAKPGWNPDPTEADTCCVEGGYVVSPGGTYLLVIMADRAGFPDEVYEGLVRALDDAYQEYAPQKEKR